MDDVVATLLLNIQSTGLQNLTAAEVQLKSLDATARTSSTAVAATAPTFEKAAGSAAKFGLLVGGAAVALDYFSVKAAVGFAASLELVHTQAGASQQEVDNLKKSVLDMATQVGTTPDQLAAGLYHIESAGFRGAVALDTLRAAAEGAKVGHADLESVTNALVAVTKSHIAGVHNQIDAVGQLNAIVGAGNMRMGDLTAAMSTGILPAARSVGISLRDVGAALAVMTDNGVPAQDAATRLRMTLSLLEAPTSKAKAALESIGLTSSQLADDMRNKGLVPALIDLETHLKDSGLTATQQAQVISGAFGGGRSSSAILTLLGNLDQVQKKYKDIGATANQFGEDWKATAQETDFQWAQIQATLEKVGVEIGDTLMPAVRTFGADMQVVVNGVSSLDHAAPGAVTGLSAIALGFLGVSILLKAGLSLWKPYADVIGYFTAQNTAAGASIARTGASAAAATPEIIGYDDALGALATTSTGIIAPLGAVSAEMDATAVAAPGAAGGIGEVGTAATGAAIGIAGLAGLVGALAIVLKIGFDNGNASKDQIHQLADAYAHGSLSLQQFEQKVRDAQGRLEPWDIELAKSTKLSYDHARALLAQKEALDALKQGLTTAPLAGGESGLNQFIAAGTGAGKGSLDYKLPAIPTMPDFAKMFEAGLKGPTDDLKLAEEAMAHALLNAGAGLDQYTAKAVGDQEGIDQHAKAFLTAKILVERAAGDWSAALKDQSAQDQITYDNLRAQLAFAIANHLQGTSALAHQAAAAAVPLLGLEKGGHAADDWIKKITGGDLPGALKSASQAAKDFASTLSLAASTSFAKAEAAAFQGKGNAGPLFDKAVQSAGKENDFSTFGERFKLKVDEASHNWAAVVSDTRTILQQAVDYWAGKLQHDQGPGGDRSAIAGDKASLSTAEGHLTSFNAEVDKTKAAAKSLGDKFQELSNSASKKATEALDALALGIKDHDPKFELQRLLEAAKAAAGELPGFTKALKEAKYDIGGPAESDSDRLKKQEGRHTQGLDDSEARIASAIEHHRQVTEADISAAQRHQRSVDADTQAHWEASYAAASVAEKYRMLAQQASELISHFSTLQSAVQSVIDAERAVYSDRTTIIKDKLDAMAKAFEDATAIFQAQSTLARDQQASVVKAIEDGTAILKASSDMLNATLQAGLSSSRESLATMGELIQVARDQLQIARDQATADEAAAAWQQTIDHDNVTIATSQMALDQLQGNVTHQLAIDQFEVDKAKLRLAGDQLKLTEITNEGIGLIASKLGADTKAYDSEIKGILSTISGDTKAVNNALTILDQDTREGYGRIALATQKLDTDRRQLATDQSASDASSSAGQQRIATDNRRVQADQEYLSALQAVDLATQAVTDAFTQLASDQSKTLVDGLNAMVTAVSDATSVFTAEAGVSSAGSAGQIKAVQDQSGIIKAEGDIAKAKTSDQLAVARDQLQIAQDTLAADQSAASWNVRIAMDQVKIASDKAAADALKATWDHTIDLDMLKIDGDKIKLAQDQLTLTEENLALEAQMVTLMGGDISSYMADMPGILKTINADQGQIATDQARQVQDQQTAAQQEATFSMQMAYDSQQLARDQAAADASSAAGQMRLAQDGNRLAADQVNEQMQTNKLLGMSLSEMQQWFAPMLDAMRNLRSGVDYHWVGSGSDPFEQFINSAPSAFASNPTA